MRRTVLLFLLFAYASAVHASPGVVQTQLAGRSLATFPYFQYVDDFDPLHAVEVAVDPTRFPEVVGRSCDLYIVVPRSEARWNDQTGLVDVRPGGPQRVTFTGSTIEANRFVVAGPGELAANPFPGLGVGYEVVLDFDLDAQLGPGDFIDGRGDEAGLYRVHDTTQTGPLGVNVVLYTGGDFLDQIVYYPSTIASMPPLPLVVVSHGWTLNYTQYGHIGKHLASYGYIVMAHSNDVGGGGGQGTHSASITTLTNTDYIIGNQATIAGGIFNGKIDSHRIVWMGHSTGGECVVRAYVRLADGEYVPQHFGIEDIALISSIAPVSFWQASLVSPRGVNFHMFGAAADIDVTGEPANTYQQLFSLYERATGNRQSTYIHGAGHMDFITGTGSSWAEGPDLIGRPAAHTVIKGYYLPLVEWYVKGNLAGREYFTRMYEDFHPLGIPANVVVATEGSEAAVWGRVVLDDYQTQPDPATSSSGGAVTFDVQHVSEVLMQDLDGSFDWTGAQPSNGMTRARFSTDTARGVVFDWTAGQQAYYQLSIPAGLRDFSGSEFLEFRACQGTRHPETDALAAGLSFTVTLEDASAGSRSIRIDHYGRITSPYRRTGAGAGAGWQNEFNTVQLRLADFATDGGVDLTNIIAVRFEFGSAHGSSRGRLGLDDIVLTPAPPLVPLPLRLTNSGSTVTIGWPSAPGALTYNVYRGTIPLTGFGERGVGAAVYDHSCYMAGVTSATDATAVPADRAAFYYLVARVNYGGQGSLGEASIDFDPVAPGSQHERPNLGACP